MSRGFEIISEYKNKQVEIPKRGTKGSAGYDFQSAEDIVCSPNKVTFVKTGIKAYMNEDEVLKIFIRSSVATKKQLVLANGTPIIDADYYNNESNEGHIMLPILNLNDFEVEIKKGERIAQGIFEKYLIADNDNANGERTGGFGSTGNGVQ